ncbi:MAG: hypothetical protein ABIS14_04965 [Sphingomonas sp.]
MNGLLAVSPKRAATEQRFVAGIPVVLDEYEARKGAERPSIIELNPRVMPAVG